MKEELGWILYKYEDYELWFKGHLLKTAIQDFFRKLRLIARNKDISPKDYKELLINTKGHFSVVLYCNGFVFASVDRICSIPIYYLDSGKQKIVGINPYLLKKFASLDSKLLLKSSAIEIAMSGYTIGSNTLYHGLNQLTAGQCLLIKDDTIKKYYYYTYSPWEVVKHGKKQLKNQLTDCLIETFEDLIKSVDGRQVVIPLSAGRDSRLVASALKYLGYKSVFCFAYGNQNNFESKTSQYVAEKLGYSWMHVPLTKKSQKSFFTSQEFGEYCDKTETYSSIPFVQDVSSVNWLKSNEIISEDAVFVNGNTGDYISGGHIPLPLKKKSLEIVDFEVMQSKSWNDFLNKHFTLWKVLRFENNDIYIKNKLISLLSDRNISILKDKETLHGFFECLEYLGRQSKYIVNMQRSYDFYGYSWRMPLWSNQMLDYWKGVPRVYKIDQDLYKSVLSENNWGAVWHDIPVNSGEINSTTLKSMRFISKMLYFPFGKDAWHSFERNVFQYFLDNSQNSSIVPYYKVLFDRRGQRQWVSWMAELYLKNKGLETITKQFPRNM